MRLAAIVILAFSLLLEGCGGAVFPLVRPVYPEPGSPAWPQQVDSLQPTFRWEPAKETDVAYDLIVYECIKTEDFWKGKSRTVGREVYYRKGLTATEHRLEEPLAPAREYYWSVRLRKGDLVSRWSVYHYQPNLLIGGTAVMNSPFLFATPGK